MIPTEIGMPVDLASGTATLANRSQIGGCGGSLPLPQVRRLIPQWTKALIAPPKPKSPAADRFVVVLDPGHGGIDPGAERDEVAEKDLMLSLARALRDALVRAGVEADADT